MGRLTKRINAEISKGLTYEAIIYKDIEHHETDFNYKALEKLAHYEDLEEQGRLIELPCAVGDTVWYIKEKSSLYPSYHTYYDWYDFRIGYIALTKRGIVFGRKGSGMFADIMFNANDIGKTVFLTKEEAEAKLAEMKGEQPCLE